jgi:hypothetical protein
MRQMVVSITLWIGGMALCIFWPVVAHIIGKAFTWLCSGWQWLWQLNEQIIAWLEGEE